MATLFTVALVLLVVFILLSRKRGRSETRDPADSTGSESFILTLGRSPQSATRAQSIAPEPHPRNQQGLVQPRSHERVTPYELVFSPATPGTPPEEVRSSKDRSISYDVDASRLTCTCPDFQRRAHLPGLFARCCKHLLWMLHERGHLADADKWVKAIATEGYGAPGEAWIVDLETAPPVLVTVAPGKEWVNVYAHTPRSGERIKTASGRIRRHGWNVDEDRWSYGEGPPGSRELTPLMKLVL